jgi:steroid 5-alpha reductase family enzyme
MIPGDQQALLAEATVLMLAVAAVTFVASELTRNYSQVDRLWSLMPIGYAWLFAARGGWDGRLVLMAALVTAWGIRLSFNFWRRGGYGWPPWTGAEDHRWAVLRKRPELASPWRWRLFNLGFISFYQNLLLLLLVTPAVVAWGARGTALNPLDGVAAALLVGFLLAETVADNQQFAFQTEKHRRLAAGAPLAGDHAAGFLTQGLFRYARHPNFAAEQGTWCAFYLFSVAATGAWLNWSVVGAVLLILLFQGSTRFTEEITASKYPGYEGYRQAVPAFLPRLGRRGRSR